jgi:hypothetical protein
MPKRNTSTAPPAELFQDAFSSYLYWLRWWEMMVASGLTIGLRLSGISYKLQKNQMPDLREIWRMGEEKNTAVLQSLGALPTATGGLSIWQQQKQMQDAIFQLWRPFYSASTANAFRLSGTRKPRAGK